MRTYGKALSTYRRINKIKSSVNTIGQAQNMMGEQRAKAIDEANRINMDRQFTDALIQGSIQGLAAAGQAFAPEDADSWRSSENITNYSTAASAIGQSLSNAVYSNRLSNEGYMGLGQSGVSQMNQDMINPADVAMQTYAMNQMLSDSKNSEKIQQMTKGGWGDSTQAQLASFANSEGLRWTDLAKMVEEGTEDGKNADIRQILHDMRMLQRRQRGQRAGYFD